MQYRMIHCPECGSEQIHKNGIKKGKQNHIFVRSSMVITRSPPEKIIPFFRRKSFFLSPRCI